MCGIYCSDDEGIFHVLKMANEKRGNFATGLALVDKKTEDVPSYNISKSRNSIDLEDILPDEFNNYNLYLGHNQAPTSSEREYNESTTHPFVAGDWIVAHNGVLTNFKDLIKDYLPDFDNPVDSSIIPALLAESDYLLGPPQVLEEETYNIESVLEVLEGTFALWMYNTYTGNLFIARQGSTLFMKGTHVSSIIGKGYEEVKEGIIYQYTKEGFKQVHTFEHTSPFFTL